MLCISLVAGGTFAIFTSESVNNIAITSGNVDVKAEITLVDLYSPKSINPDGSIADAADVAGETFINGGTASVEGNEVNIVNIAPGDKATFRVDIINNSTIDFIQRLVVETIDNEDNLLDQLLVGVSKTLAGPYIYVKGSATGWEEGKAIKNGVAETASLYVSVELPAFAGNEWKNKTCKLAVAVTAVQGNVNAIEEADYQPVAVVNNQLELTAAIAAGADDVVLYGEKWATAAVTLSETDSRTLTLRGTPVGTLTVNAPAATVNVYNNVDTIVGEAVPMNSLHIFGNANIAEIKSGRIVIENGANVDVVKANAEANGEVIVLLPAADSKVGKIIVNGAEGSVAQLNINKNTVIEKPEIEHISGEYNEVYFDNSAATAEDFQIALDAAQNGETITLSDNIVITEANGGTSGKILPIFTISGEKSITVDLNGKTISFASELAGTSITGIPCVFVVNGASVTLKNGTVDAECGNNGAYGIDALGGANVTIESGTYTGAPTAVQVRDAKVVINGGHFELAETVSTVAPANVKYLINCVDANYKDGTAVVEICGGSFKNFDPKNNAAEGANTDFTAYGHTTTANGDIYTAHQKADYVLIHDVEELFDFAETVNGGNTLDGMTVGLLADIDLA